MFSVRYQVCLACPDRAQHNGSQGRKCRITGKLAEPALANNLLYRDDTAVRGYSCSSNKTLLWLTSNPAVTMHRVDALDTDADAILLPPG